MQSHTVALSVPECDACLLISFQMLYLYAVMEMARPAWANLIPQLCSASLTWDHLVSLCPAPDSCSVAFPLPLQQHHPSLLNAADAGKLSHTSSSKTDFLSATMAKKWAAEF